MTRRLAALVVAALLLPLGAAGAQETADAVRITSVSTEEYPTVRIQVAAPIQAVGGQLTGENVTVVENGVTHDVTVTPTSAENLDVVLAVDTSGSMLAGDAIGAARAAAVDFVGQMPAGTNFAVIEFSAVPSVVLGLTPDAGAASVSIEGLQAGGETALYDALAEATALLETGTGSRQVIVLLSDGADTSSTRSQEEAGAALQGSAATLYAIELLTPDSDTAALEALVGAADGRLVTTPDAAVLQTLYAEVAADLLNRYELAYTSSARGPAALTLELATATGTLQLDRRITLPFASAVVDEPALPAPPPAVVPEPALYEQSWVFAAGAAVVFLGLSVLVLVLLLLPGRESGQLTRDLAVASRASGRLPRWVGRFATLFERPLQRASWGGSLNRALEQAGLQIRPAEFLTFAVAAGLAATVVGWAVGGWLLAVAFAVVALFAPRMVISWFRSRRQDAFADQLGDTLQLLAGNLRAGHGFMQALAGVADDAESPTSEEFSRVVTETRLGRDTNDALEAMDERMGSIDFSWVVQAIAIHRDVGGDLAYVLDEVAATIRERNQIRGQIKALSAEGRLSAGVLVIMPFVAAGGLILIQPDYVAELIHNRVGWIMIGIAAVAMLVGTVWIRRVIRIVF